MVLLLNSLSNRSLADFPRSPKEGGTAAIVDLETTHTNHVIMGQKKLTLSSS